VILTFDKRAAHLQQLLNGVQAQEVTYAEVGQTCQQALPPGYRHQRRQAVVGHGPEVWARAREALATWQAHRHLGLGIYPADAPVTPGAVVLAIARVGPARLVLPCRVVYRTDEPRSFGFAYGTLPGHPERGEESFHVTWEDQGAVSFSLVAFSRPGDMATRLAGPVATLIQSAATSRYIAGVKAYVSGAGSTQ
jgi:uncharacterized protein (UPF0548 family)